jgi:adenosine deaminase
VLTSTTTPQPSPLTLISTIVLSNHHVLDLLWDRPFHDTPRKDERHAAVFAGFRPWAARWPDHVFEGHWDRLNCSVCGDDWLLAALAHGSGTFLHHTHGELRVQADRFAIWQQEVVSRVSGLPLAAAAQAKLGHSLDARKITNTAHSFTHPTPPRALSPLLLPYDPLVEDYIDREGLHDTHRHLNGSTFAEACWLQALRAPHTEARTMSATLSRWQTEGKGRKVKELANAITPGFTGLLLYERLRCAAALRRWLVGLSSEGWHDKTSMPFDMVALMDKPPPFWVAPLDLTAGATPIDAERAWMVTLLAQLQQRPNAAVSRMLHLYLLLFNQYYGLQVQSAEQFGFDQFQRLTDMPLRNSLEDADYLQRFWVAHGPNPMRSVARFMDGRFAPKATPEKNAALLQKVLRDYWVYLTTDAPPDPNLSPKKSMGPLAFGQLLNSIEDQLKRTPREHKLRLALVAHFIKSPWSPNSKKSGSYRHHPQRKKLKANAEALLHTLNAYPRLRLWVRGVDAAANELDADPEVFANVFDACRHAGLAHRTFHVGEDFRHLLGGLRVMHDAIDLLKLDVGDRIGHGTAMGIDPALWLSRSPQQVLVTKGAWLLDLLQTWCDLSSIPQCVFHTQKVRSDITKLARELFERNIAVESLRAAMDLRHLNPVYVKKWVDSKGSALVSDEVSPTWRPQAQAVETAWRAAPDSVKLLWDWWSDKALWKRSDMTLEVPADYFDDGGATLIALQQALMGKVNKQGLVIEALPSSNVRISVYQHMGEHHALRWMRVDSHLKAGDPPIEVSLGSDDTGIFNCEIPSEFYQLYLTARQQGLGASDALARVAVLNERGRTHRFHDRERG